jgi:hypothetical protein
MLRNAKFCLAVTLGLTAGVALAQDKPDAVTDAAKAGPEFAIQGEYLGEFSLGDGVDQKFGLQVIALGEDKYHGVAYFGGLPGEGWDGFGKLETDSEVVDGEVRLVANEGSAVIKDGVATIKTVDDQELGKLKKYERKSSTLEAKPPEGAIVLFDGTSADNFTNATLTPDKFLLPKGDALSKQKFQDFTLHLEFRTPYMPTASGQGRGNSGVYLQNRYEVQILDSFGLEGLDDECGALYSKKAPRENSCYPPLTWQTYDIDFTAPKFEGDKKVKNAIVTVKHNGNLIHENQEVDGETPGGSPEGPEAGPIRLQDHGNPVVFKNIWVVEKK